MNEIPAIRAMEDDGLGIDFDSLIPACLTSVVLHMALVVVLGAWFLPRVAEKVDLVITSQQIEEPKPEEIPELQQFRLTHEEHPEIGSASSVGADVVASVAPVVAPIVQVTVRQMPVEPGVYESPLLHNLAAAPQLSQTVSIKGAAGVGAVGAVGAVDRITEEILTSIEQRPTLVVWMFDRSGSMQAQRSAINRRFERIYKELGASHLVAGANKKDAPLLSSVVAFGQETNFLTPEPTDDLAAVQKAVTQIKNDPSGVETTFSTISTVVHRYQHFRTDRPARNIMIVVFTDEVGDDEERAEATATLCRRLAIPVYVVGVPAPFGRRDLEVRYVDPDPKYDQSERWIPVRQGPETLMPEAVSLGFVGHIRRDDDLYRIDSGFGPYWLTRLCFETGGIYFAVHPNRPESGSAAAKGETPLMSAKIDQFFDPTVMRHYVPDYLPPTQYQHFVSANKARLSLIQAAQAAAVMPMDKPTFEFRKSVDDEAAFKRQLDDAQKAAAYIEPRIDAIYRILKQGEPDRAKITEPRWRAGFDLAMGRVLAAKVRTESYNQMLAKAKQGIKGKTSNANVFTIQPADEISVGSAIEKQARLAREYLERVVREHPNTPWAYLAKVDLNHPIGWKWEDRYEAPPPTRPQSPVVMVAAPNNGGGGPPSTAPPPKPKPKRDVNL